MREKYIAKRATPPRKRKHMTTPTVKREQPWWLVLAVFFALTALAAATGGLFRPGAWYAALTKPAWNPPNWIFAPVWTALYVMIAISGALAWRAGASPRSMTLWGLQLILNAAWTFLFFGLERPGLALIEIAALWVAIALYARSVVAVERRSALLVQPYLAWVTFAAILNAALWWGNR
jgi:translocator protein